MGQIRNKMVKFGTGLVRIGQIRNRIGQIGQNRNDSEWFFRKFRIRNVVPIIGTSGNPGTHEIL